MKTLPTTLVATFLAWMCAVNCAVAQIKQAERVVKREQLKCVIDHLKTYSESKEDPVIIYLSICPETTMTTDAIRKLQQNSLPNPGQGQAAPLETVLVLMKSELGCLSAYQVLANDRSQDLVHVRTPVCDQ
jgi:hypothetical protein